MHSTTITWGSQVCVISDLVKQGSLAHKNVHFEPFLPPMTPETVHRGDSDVPQNSQIFLFPEVNVPPISQ